ncbi:MAG: hypothetical protein COB04_12875 [Gammaproteobacteria bacterium]|nr:MAG: hypothetical protein COB04_12875 [Gammaproteobacteria bacterium]
MFSKRGFSAVINRRHLFYQSLNTPAVAVVHTLVCGLCFEVGLFRMELWGFVSLFSFFWFGHGLLVWFMLWSKERFFVRSQLVLGQMIWAIITVLVSAYFVDQMRSIIMMMFLAVMTIGTFHLQLRGFLLVASLGVCGFGLVLYLLAQFQPHTVMGASQLLSELLQFGALILVTGIFVLLGTRISNMRQQLVDKNDALIDAYDQIHEMAICDELTGLYNRRYIMEVLERQKNISDRQGQSFAFCFIDLDYFKAVNDTYGHSAGDKVLKVCAELMQSSIRNIDYCARFGGEEFVMVLVDANLAEAVEVAERVRGQIERYDFKSQYSDLSVSTSIGVTVFGFNEPLEATVSRADEMVYKAKDDGRNCVRSTPAPLNIAVSNLSQINRAG